MRFEPRETERLHALSRYDILDSPPEPVFDDLTALAADVCEVPISLITFLDRTREWFKSSVGLSRREVPRLDAFSAQTMMQTDVLVVPDATRDIRFADNPLVKGEPHIRFYAGYPILSADGYGLGALCVLDRTPHELDEKQRQFLRMLGHEVTMLLELRRETHEKQHRNEQQAAELTRLQEQLIVETAQHKRAEEELAGRERQLADAQRLAKLGSWEWDLKTDTVSWSDELYRIFGLQPNGFKATYEDYLKRIHPDDRAKADALITATLETSGSFIYEKRIIRSDGAIRTLYSSGEVILNQAKRPIRMVGFAQDVTERKEMEAKLEESVSLLNSILESTADAILAVDLQGRLIGHNQKFLDMWQLPTATMTVYQDEMVLQRVMDRLKDPDSFLAKVQELYAHPEQESMDVLEFKDGRVYERYSRPQYSGEIIAGRVWSFRDVTERYLTLETLRQSEERYRSFVMASAQIVWVNNAEGYAVEESPSWGRFTGQTKEQMLGYGWLNAVHPMDRERVYKAWSQPATERRVYETELRLRRADGEWRDMLSRSVPIFGPNGELREWIGSSSDITDRKRAEEEIKKLNQELENRVRERTRQLHSSNKELQSFSYTISHDLKAPLRAITGFTEAIKEDCRAQLDDEHWAYLDRIIQSAGRMSRLIDDLLTYSRLGRSSVHLHPVPLNDFLRKVAGDFTMQIEALGGTLSVSPDLPVVNADPSLLTQVFSNLIENAMTYRKPDVPLEVSITSRTEGSNATVCVTDNGIGIAPSHHERIFEVFQRLHTEQTYPGTGIGLANVKKAVEMQGGEVWVESEPEKGSTFCVKFHQVT